MGASARAFILSVGFILQARIIQNAPSARKRTSGVTGGRCVGPTVGSRGGVRKEMVCVAVRRVRFPAVEALAQAHVAPCVTGVRQSQDCLRPLPLRRPCVFASASPFVSGNRPHFHGDWSRPSVPRARPGRRRACAFRRRTPGLRLRGGCGAILSSRAAPPAHPPRHPPPAAPARLASPRARPVRPLHGSAHIQSQGVYTTMARRNLSPYS